MITRIGGGSMNILKLHNCRNLPALVLLLILIVLAFASVPATAQYIAAPNSLRVALGLNLNSAEFSVSEGEYELIDFQTQRVINPSVGLVTGSWLCAPAGAGNLQISNSSTATQDISGSVLLLRQKNSSLLNVFRFQNKRYRGDLLLQNYGGKLHVINVVDVEQYLYGVVGAEMGSSAPDEALKAQAVVSRTYAYYCKEHPQLLYDLGTTTQWQVYNGYDGEVLSGQRIKAAVDATCGQVITYNGSVIQAFFHANSGGYTEACENVWSSSIPYIQPVPSPYDSYALQVAQSNGWPASTYQWERTFTRAEISELINKWNSGHPEDPIRIGEFKELRASRQAVNPATNEFMSTQTVSQRVTQLDFVGSSGVKSFFKDKVRSVLNLPSSLFNIYTDSMVSIWNAFGYLETVSVTKDLIAITVDGYRSNLNGNNSAYYVATADGVKQVSKQFSSLTISGKGSGHGLGLSQWGARGMAAQGSNYQQIIYYYYGQGNMNGAIQIRSYL